MSSEMALQAQRKRRTTAEKTQDFWAVINANKRHFKVLGDQPTEFECTVCGEAEDAVVIEQLETSCNELRLRCAMLP